MTDHTTELSQPLARVSRPMLVRKGTGQSRVYVYFITPSGGEPQFAGRFIRSEYTEPLVEVELVNWLSGELDQGRVWTHERLASAIGDGWASTSERDWMATIKKFQRPL